MKRIDLNCDMGEDPGGHCRRNAGIVDALSYVDQYRLRRPCWRCANHGSHHRAGASLESGGGRASRVSRSSEFWPHELNLPPETIADSVFEQVRALAEIAAGCGAGVTHVKPHGALYNQAATNRVLPKRLPMGSFAGVAMSYWWVWLDRRCWMSFRSRLPCCRGGFCGPAVRGRWQPALAEI